MICVICGINFESNRNWQKCCSKNCSIVYQKEWRLKYKKEFKQYNQKYYKDNKNKFSQYKKQYYQYNKEIIKNKHKEYYQNNKEKSLKYYQDNKEKIKYNKKKYYQDNKEKSKERNKKYRELHKDYLKQYQVIYQQTPKGKEIFKKSRDKRYRNLGFIPLNEWFENSNGHHIDKINVIYIPKELHTSVWHSISKNINMEEINMKAWDFFESQAY